MDKDHTEFLKKLEDIDITEKYMKRLEKTLPKDKKVVAAYLTAAKDLVDEQCKSMTLDFSEKMKMVVEVYFMLRKQETIRSINEYYVMMFEATKLGIKDISPVIPNLGELDSDKPKGFGFN